MSTLGNNNYSIMLRGDLNSRTGKLNIFRDIDMSNIRDDFVESRSSQDHTVNNFGRSLLSMCAALELTILNGSLPHIASCNLTYISVHGNSLIDYLITSFDLLKLYFNIKVGENILSPHMPIEAIYYVTRIPENQSEEQDLPHTVFRWRHEQMPTYIQNVLQLFQHMSIDDHFGKEFIEDNVAPKLLSEALMKAADCMSF